MKRASSSNANCSESLSTMSASQASSLVSSPLSNVDSEHALFSTSEIVFLATVFVVLRKPLSDIDLNDLRKFFATVRKDLFKFLTCI